METKHFAELINVEHDTLVRTLKELRLATDNNYFDKDKITDNQIQFIFEYVAYALKLSDSAKEQAKQNLTNAGVRFLDIDFSDDVKLLHHFLTFSKRFNFK